MRLQVSCRSIMLGLLEAAICGLAEAHRWHVDIFHVLHAFHVC